MEFSSYENTEWVDLNLDSFFSHASTLIQGCPKGELPEFFAATRVPYLDRTID